jgi:hypothetical protein
MGFNHDTLLQLKARAFAWARTQSRQARVYARRLQKPSTIPLLLATLILPVLAIFNIMTASASPGRLYVAGSTFPFDGVWLESTDGGHYWDASSNGICRTDADAASPTGFSEAAGTCDVQAKKPTQAVVGPVNADGTYYVYESDMSSKSGGPVRVVYDPTADGGKGLIVPSSAVLVGGLNTVGFFSDAGGDFKASSIQLGPCNHSTANPVAAGPCLALYVGFLRSQKIERINFVDQPNNVQTIEDISKNTDKRKGLRFGIGMFHNADGTDDLYLPELGGNGVSMIHDVATCTPSAGPSGAGVTNPPVNANGGCAASLVPGITTNFPQGVVVQNDPATGVSQYIYTADSPRNSFATILRYNPVNGFQDVIGHTINPTPSLLNPGEIDTTYSFILGLALNPHNNDLFIGEDQTFSIIAPAIPPPGKGRIFLYSPSQGDTPDCTATALQPTCPVPQPPQTVTPSLFAYGVTAPKGGGIFMPADDGGHTWLADHSQGFCRFDTVKAIKASDGTYLADPIDGTIIGLNAINSSACDDGTQLGSGGQAVYDDSIVVGTTNHHYVYVAQNDHLSQGMWRFEYDPSADPDPISGLGRGALVAGSGVVMAPGAGLNGDKANALALGPCKPGAPVTCKHSLYMGGLVDGFIRRINNPEDDPRNMTVDVVAMTTAQRAGTTGRGINGSMGMIGDDLYLPENLGFTVVHNISQCPTVVQGTPQVCATNPLPIGQFGFIFAAGVGTDPDVGHFRSAAGLVYASISSGVATATIYQYDVATNTSRIFTTQGLMPAAGSAEASVYCTTTCTRPIDPANPPGGQANFRFAQGVWVGPDDAFGNDTVYIAEDAFAGARGGRGHIWTAPGLPYPAGVTPVPTSTPIPAGTTQVCNITLNVPSLASGQTWWVQFTAHAQGQITATWKIPVAQSAQFLLYPGNPFAGLADPVSTGAKGGSIASQNTSNTASFSISTAPTSEPAGTYTLQFFNASNTFAATTGTLQYVNDNATACPTSPTSLHTLP